MRHISCLRCGRKLKTEASQELGFGKVCWEKYNADTTYKELFEMEVQNEKADSSTNDNDSRLSNNI